ncbi:putative Platelet-activating factor acetylhydrolase IB subunit alpha [Blattamonas nauphoetae]|uniref:Platelet-activating factor acetylhydrolase IB subunit alpha n=1 Tax=Blattamonas nauphoetae TaxID=2049346 RepID=A0ABQ9X3G2_9EUKA|nr:putative Platelet-activating factor acetylhydrolase IB subunit alpha [Blattamonas nauphoetae]
MATASDSFTSRGAFKNHGDWVTSICTAGNLAISASRDRKVCIWNVNAPDSQDYMVPFRTMTGHNHFIQDMCLSSNGNYAITASWDKTLRLWDLAQQKTIASFNGHTKDVLSVSLSRNNRQIISSSRDNTIKLWNIHGECKYTTPAFQEWVTCVRFGLTDDNSPIVSCGYDRFVRVWDRNTFQPLYAMTGHTGFVNTLAISADSSVVASGGHDGTIILNNIKEGQHMFTLPTNDNINQLAFSPNDQILACAADGGLKVFDFYKKSLLADLKLTQADLMDGVEENADAVLIKKTPKCTSVCFAVDGSHIYAGYADGFIRTWNINTAKLQ